MKKIEELDYEAQNAIMEYKQNHSLRETSEFIKNTYGLEVSYVTVKKFVSDSFKNLPSEMKDLTYTAVIEAQDILDQFDKLYNSTNSARIKLQALKAKADFVSKLIDYANLRRKEGIEETKTTTESHKLKWDTVEGELIST